MKKLYALLYVTAACTFSMQAMEQTNIEEIIDKEIIRLREQSHPLRRRIQELQKNNPEKAACIKACKFATQYLDTVVTIVDRLSARNENPLTTHVASTELARARNLITFTEKDIIKPAEDTTTRAKL